MHGNTQQSGVMLSGAVQIAPSLMSLVERVESQARLLDETVDSLARTVGMVVPLGNRSKTESLAKHVAGSNLTNRLHDAVQLLVRANNDLCELHNSFNNSIGGDAPVPVPDRLR